MTLESRVNEYRHAAAETLAAVEGWVKVSSTLSWTSTDGTLPLVRSSLIKRQHECLSIAVDLTDKGQGFAAVGFLRPACEEFLWTKYLSSMSKADAEALLAVMARREIWDSLKAQDLHAGKKGMSALGLAPYFKSMESRAKQYDLVLKALGTKLHWDKRAIDSGSPPSMSFIAKAVGETKLYKLLYHASSRYVHFSPQELMRRAWGKEGDITISSSHFADYWASFVLYWGVYLLAATFSAACALDEPTELDDSIDADRLMKATSVIGDLGPVPIITAGELAWP